MFMARLIYFYLFISKIVLAKVVFMTGTLKKIKIK